MAARHFKYRCEPAYTVVMALGGCSSIARVFGLSKERISQWTRPAVRGGTGGYIPIEYWEPIVVYAKRVGHGDVVTKGLVSTSRREVLRMGRGSRVKGDRFEYQVTHELLAAGVNAHRVPLSGAVKGYDGDVKCDSPLGPWILQCKISAHGRGKMAITRFLNVVACGLVKTPYGNYVGMRKAVFLRWMNGHPPVLVNFCELETPVANVTQEIQGHNALIYRKDRSLEWYALIPAVDFWKVTRDVVKPKKETA